MKEVRHFNVGNGNCSVVQGDNFVMAIDLNGSEDENSFDMIKPYLRLHKGVLVLDMLVVTHGDRDHCGGFAIFKEKIDEGKLVIGTIMHQGYDRSSEGSETLSSDYLALQKEISRRGKVDAPSFGDLVHQPKAGETETFFNDKIENWPSDLYITIFSPIVGDSEDSEYSVNDLSIVLKLDFKGLSFLYAGDTTSKYCQDRLIPWLENNKSFKDLLSSDILVVSHHGSATFFGKDRESVRDAIPLPDNYETLDLIAAGEFILSAGSKFPTGRDASGDNPPHYAAWKWYHKWMRDNLNVAIEDKHPSIIHYTCEGNKRWSYNSETEKWCLNPISIVKSKSLKEALPAVSPKIWGGY
jgi:beta-lactamase superfamily II metal-dependent hydrolase